MSAEPLPTPEDVLEATFRARVGDVPLDGPWEIQDRGAAAWAVSKIRQAHHTYDVDTIDARNAIDALRAEADRIQEQVDARAKDRDHTVEWFTAHLTDWLRRLREDDPEVKSVKLPGGTVKSRAGREIVTYEDAEAVARYADEHGLDFAAWEPAVDKGPLLRHVKATGEAPPGVAVERTDTTYSVDLDGAS